LESGETDAYGLTHYPIDIWRILESCRAHQPPRRGLIFQAVWQYGPKGLALGVVNLSKIATPARFIAVTFDTQTVMHNSFNFGGGLLAQLKQFAGSPIQVPVSEIVIREIHQRLLERTEEARKRLRAANRDARDLGLPVQGIEREPEADASQIAQARIDHFLETVGAETVPAKGVSLSAVIDRYFAKQPPFSTKKRDEFPDAIALLSLERWARNYGPVLVVSGDHDWREFAEQSRYLGHTSALGEALQHFQPHLTDAAKQAVKLFKRFMEGPDLQLPNLFWEAFRDEITTLPLNVTAWHSELEVVAETSEFLPRRTTLYADTARLRIVGESQHGMVIEIPISVEGDLQAHLELIARPAKFDHVDIALARYIEGVFLVHLRGDLATERIDEIRIESLNRSLAIDLGPVDRYFYEP
jgi:hypothetical protein